MGIQDYKKSDATGRAHQYRLYTSVLEQQQELYSSTNDITHNDYNNNYDNDDDENDDGSNNNYNNYMPTTGFSIGSLCNTNENMCVSGSDCKRTSWWHDWSAICQPMIDDDVSSSFYNAYYRQHSSSSSSSSSLSSSLSLLSLLGISACITTLTTLHILL